MLQAHDIIIPQYSLIFQDFRFIVNYFQRTSLDPTTVKTSCLLYIKHQISFYLTGLSIAVYGEKQSGKTTCALDLGQYPFTELPPSLVFSVLQTFIKTKTDQILGLQIHDSNQFIKSHNVIFIVNACKPEPVNFLNKYIQQLTEDQLVFIFVNKCDIATKQEFIQANNKALELLKEDQQSSNGARNAQGQLQPLTITERDHALNAQHEILKCEERNGPHSSRVHEELQQQRKGISRQIQREPREAGLPNCSFIRYP
ncbi:Conserved_hypothetical protein [Hexamita inflata]|uniref:Uncharacterized protein n=1 Tax=Hexamita inflata TaxID=28002 RepID=A0AA86QM59_9EUKA|nr:Conserved hypothetical protein [Hexamita inflata]